MAFSFECPSCQATISGSQFLAGRRVRCPQCDTLIKADDGGRGTVSLVPAEDDQQKTVLLEAVEVHEAVEDAATSSVGELAQPTRLAVGAPQDPPATDRAASRQVDEAYPPLIAGKHREEAAMDMTPMVDVTFLLLIFFMVTATFTLQKSLEIPRSADPAPATAVQEIPPEPAEFVIVQIDQYNTFQVSTVDWEEEAPSEHDLHVLLRRARQAGTSGTIPARLRVEAHGDCLHERVVTAIDAGTATGFEEVQLATLEDD